MGSKRGTRGKVRSDKGPKVVAVGGGHGLAATLRAARRYAGTLTAIVSVADDGGSSGRLRSELGIVPPGDLRKCLVALADFDDSVARSLARAFEHRFRTDELAGHALGNLVIAALADTTGDLQSALDEAGSLLRTAGRVLPASYEPVVLVAETAEGREVRGQIEVMRTSRIRRISLDPADVPAPVSAIDAISEADQVIIGPGSLYTSVLAALAVPEIRKAVENCDARTVYVANLRPQNSETSGYDIAAHVTALFDHGVTIDTVVADTSGIAVGDLGSLAVPGLEVVEARIAKKNGLAHDPGKLTDVLVRLV